MKKSKPWVRVKSVCHSCTTWSNPEYVQKLAQRGVTSFSMDTIPRISRAGAWTYSSLRATSPGTKAGLDSWVQNKWPKIFRWWPPPALITPSKGIDLWGGRAVAYRPLPPPKDFEQLYDNRCKAGNQPEQAESLECKFITVKDDGVKVEASVMPKK